MRLPGVIGVAVARSLQPKVWPYELTDDKPLPQFYDCNFSLGRTAPEGTNSTNPWRTNTMPTLTGCGMYTVRFDLGFWALPFRLVFVEQ